MSRFVACVAFLFVFPLLFAAAMCGSEYAYWLVNPDDFPDGADPIPGLLAGHISPYIAGTLFAVLGFGIYDIVDLFGGLSDYRGGMRGILPKNHPTKFLLLRVRRYVFVFVVGVAAFVVCYQATTRNYEHFRNHYRPHLYAVGAAFLVARRPLNSSPLFSLFWGLHGLLGTFAAGAREAGRR